MPSSAPVPRRRLRPRPPQLPPPCSLPPHLRQDFAASLVVFLVALPLCVGIAVASGVPAELGLVTGIVGGLVTGAMRGSSFQVSGPAAGLTVLVLETVRTFGAAGLGRRTGDRDHRDAHAGLARHRPLQCRGRLRRGV
ncbi:SulP family inorganic anion transporter, partial [Streptomyces filamentosus]|uniref:SulP family inorganic anion transporter n=1 Tax=Streptomyces filamentosus TaxID=67294 RepID=UPI0033ED7BBD